MTKMILFTGKSKFIEQSHFIFPFLPGGRYDFILTKIPRIMTLFRFGVRFVLILPGGLGIGLVGRNLGQFLQMAEGGSLSGFI